MKHLKLIAIVLSVVIAAVAVFAATQYIANNYLDKQDDHKAHAEVNCKQKGQTHYVVIENNAMVPKHTYANLCDTLKVTNKDDKVRRVAFGAHDHHQTYDGQEENTLAKDQVEEVVLNKAGTYMIHDHLDYRVQGDFTVKE